MTPPLVLASQSPRRLQLLQQANITPDHIIPADIDETIPVRELPRQAVERLACEKMRAVQKEHQDKVIIAADTVVVTGRRIFGKPESLKQAQFFIEKLSGRRHRVITGVSIGYQDRLWQKTVETIVQFKRLTDQEIAFYLKQGEWEGRAGGYTLDGMAASFIKMIRGSYTNVLGLPLLETLNILQQVYPDVTTGR